MNLINDPWIPVLRRSGARTRIRPAEITSGLEVDPIVAIDATRADFETAWLQFLIGLLQTAWPDLNENTWTKLSDAPPTPEVLEAAFAPWARWFQLLDGEDRFMQEAALASNETANAEGISWLLIDTTAQSCTWFGKQDELVDAQLCPSCAAVAVFTLQTNAPGGGRGHRTSLRGGGPLTTLLVGEILWETLWLNVVELKSEVPTPDDAASVARVFAWVRPLRTSDDDAKTRPQDAHALQMFWGLPRRALLERSPQVKPCCVCGRAEHISIGGVKTRPKGVNYESWRHTLTPYRKQKDDSILPVLTPGDGVGWADWLGLALGEAHGVEPANVVIAGASSVRKRRHKDQRLRAFGFSMNNAKARAWADSTMPLLVPEADEDRAALRGEVVRIIDATRLVEWEVVVALQAALAPHGKIPADQRPMIRDALWQPLEGAFFAHVEQLIQVLETEGSTVEARQSWRKLLRERAEATFDLFIQPGHVGHGHPERIARAWDGLRRGLYGKKLNEALDLLVEAKA